MVKSIHLKLDENVFRQLKNLKETYMIKQGLTIFSWEDFFIKMLIFKK